MKEALKTLALPDDDKLERQLTSALYGYRNDNEIALVPKEIMKRQHGVESPDDADALAITYAYPVQKVPVGHGGGVNKIGQDGAAKASTEYNPFD